MNRLQLALGFAMAALAVGSTALVCTMWAEADRLTETTLDVGLPSWKATRPLRAVLVADVHADDLHMTQKRLGEIVDRIEQANGQVIFLAGDYIGGDWGKGEFNRSKLSRSSIYNDREVGALKQLGALHAPLGVYAVLGNHDCTWSCALTEATLAKDQIHVLQNASVHIQGGGFNFFVVGLGDDKTGFSDPDKAFSAALGGMPEITLLHEPDPFVLHPDNRNKLQLSGHTHGGQIRLPLFGTVFRNSLTTDETLKGWLSSGNRVLIVTRGLGESGVPLRLGSPPEYMVLNIHYSPVVTVTKVSERYIN